AEARRAVEVAHPEDRRPGDPAVVLHGVEVHAPRIARFRRRLLRLREGRPGKLRLDRIAFVAIAVVVDRAVDADGAHELRAPLLVTEGTFAAAVRAVVVVVLRVEDEVLRIDLDLVVVLVVAVAIGIEHYLYGISLPEVRVFGIGGKAAAN